MPGAGLEPAWAFEVPQDFKSCASANFAIPADIKMNVKLPRTTCFGSDPNFPT